LSPVYLLTTTLSLAKSTHIVVVIAGQMQVLQEIVG
jgi:hypothetical protein